MSSRQTTRRSGRNVVPKRRSGTWIVFAIAAILFSSIVALFVVRSQGTGPIDGLITIPDVPAGHADGDLSFAQTPPVGGIHNGAWQNCGIYDQPIRNENAVHSLEHGAVWVTYQPDLPAADIEALRAAVRGKTYTLLSPFENLPAPVVASAWGVQVQLSDASDARLGRFITTYRQGQQAPEPGAACIGALGTPVER